MANVDSPPIIEPDRQLARRIGLALVGLVLAGCCFWSGLGAWLFAPLTPFLANRLSYSQGKAEVIAPAQWRPGGGHMSPDGRYMVLGWIKDGPHELFVWDLVTGERHPFRVSTSALCWLNSNQFAILDSSSMSYYLVQAQNATLTRATNYQLEKPTQSRELSDIKAHWQAAEQLYVLSEFGQGAYTVIALENGQPVVYTPGHAQNENIAIVNELTRDIPHARIPDHCDSPPEGRDVYSPDGRYYYHLSMSDNAHVLIYNREGQLVAEAAKTGWTPRMLGWAHDSSSVYFQMLIAGGAASMLVPYEPIVKLSPLTPEEEQLALIWRIGTWAIGVGALGGVGWWLWRRKRRRVR
jgi:hypothetical protein